MREVGVGDDGEDGAFFALGAAPPGYAQDVVPGGGVGCGLVVGDCPGFEDGFLGGGELPGKGLVLRKKGRGVETRRDVQLCLEGQVGAAGGEW